MRRFFLPPEQCKDREFSLTGTEARHAIRVLRIQPGEIVTILDGRGTRRECRVARVEKHALHLEVNSISTTPPVPCPITLAQGLPKGKSMDSIVQKATELGVARIVPVLSEHSEVRLRPADLQPKVDKWTAVAREAMKQSGNAWMPEIRAPVDPAHALEQCRNCEIQFAAILGPNARNLKTWSQKWSGPQFRLPSSIALWIGPEGDFSKSEIQALRTARVHPITLGPRILRCETAALAALAILHHEIDAAGA